MFCIGRSGQLVAVDDLDAAVLHPEVDRVDQSDEESRLHDAGDALYLAVYVVPLRGAEAEAGERRLVWSADHVPVEDEVPVVGYERPHLVESHAKLRSASKAALDLRLHGRVRHPDDLDRDPVRPASAERLRVLPAHALESYSRLLFKYVLIKIFS